MKRIVHFFLGLILIIFVSCEKTGVKSESPELVLEDFSYRGISIRFYAGIEYFNGEPHKYSLDSVFFFNEEGEQQAVDLIENDRNGDFFHPIQFYTDSVDRANAFSGVNKDYWVEFRPTDPNYPVIKSSIQIFTRFRLERPNADAVRIKRQYLIFDEKDTVDNDGQYHRVYEIYL